MRYLFVGLLSLCCCELFAQEKRRMFEVPFAKESPRTVQNILDEAVKELRNATRGIYKDTEQKLKGELAKFQDDKRLAEANFTQAVLGSFPTWVSRKANEEFVFSPIGRWHGVERPAPDRVGRGIVELKADGSATGSWHTNVGLWTQDSYGRVRMIVTASRFIIEADMIDEDTMRSVPEGNMFKRIK